jgi:hypothetical protein
MENFISNLEAPQWYPAWTDNSRTGTGEATIVARENTGGIPPISRTANDS